jgi:hypothetical protein
MRKSCGRFELRWPDDHMSNGVDIEFHHNGVTTSSIRFITQDAIQELKDLRHLIDAALATLSKTTP